MAEAVVATKKVAAVGGVNTTVPNMPTAASSTNAAANPG